MMKKQVIAVLLSAAMVSSVAVAASGAEGQSSDDTVVIRYGMHWLPDIDPYYTDPVTGEYTMEESKRQASIAALQAVKDTYNVEFEFLQFPNDVSTDLMTSVLAGEPISDLAVLWNGVEPTILAQNVVQDLTPYLDLFEGEGSWLLGDSLFNGYYLMSNEMPNTDFPFVVNLTLLEAVDSLKDENGNTVYPMDLFEQGEWTWSTFKNYLEQIQAYYANVESADGTHYEYVQAYETDHRYAALAAMYSNGGGILRDGEITANSEESIEAVQFIKELMDAGLLVDCGTYDNGFTPRWTEGGADFGSGATVFTDCPSWLIGWEASQCAERGESIGIIPWPRPDDLAADSEEYLINAGVGNSTVVLKGVPEDRARLAIQSYILYWNTFYKTLGGVDSIEDYRAGTAVTTLANDYGVDVFNETYGDSLIDCYTFILNHHGINYAGKMGLWDKNWEYIVGKSLYGVEGMGSYDVAINANLTDLTNAMDRIAAALQSDEIHDNQAPNVTTETAVLVAGTDAASVDWTQYFTAEDSVDGPIEITADNITVSEELDLAAPGEYSNAVTVAVSDTSDNERTSSITVVVYNADNTEAPVVEAVEELPVIALNTETSGIDWTAYLASAVDADGLDVKSSVTANLSTLDTTTPGTYGVTLTVTDYAGNTAEIIVDVTVE